ncbi:MAG: chemotaxis protein CheW [SAR324 cluster bacterium]|nr:chemotaxis protein CheW [SAR324 cluster bacterium]
MEDFTEDITSEEGMKILVFLCGDQEYALPIELAREVVGMMPIDKFPQTPDYIEGMMNLRGKIVPVMNLRTKLGVEKIEENAENCIVVVNLNGEQTGVIVDFLVGVSVIDQNDLEESPDLGDHIHNNYVKSIAKLEKRVILIIDAKSLLAYDRTEETAKGIVS